MMQGGGRFIMFSSFLSVSPSLIMYVVMSSLCSRFSSAVAYLSFKSCTSVNQLSVLCISWRFRNYPCNTSNGISGNVLGFMHFFSLSFYHRHYYHNSSSSASSTSSSWHDNLHCLTAFLTTAVIVNFHFWKFQEKWGRSFDRIGQWREKIKNSVQ